MLSKINIKAAISNAAFRNGNVPGKPITDIYWPASELYRERGDGKGEGSDGNEEDAGESGDESNSED